MLNNHLHYRLFDETFLSHLLLAKERNKYVKILKFIKGNSWTVVDTKRSAVNFAFTQSPISNRM